SSRVRCSGWSASQGAKIAECWAIEVAEAFCGRRSRWALIAANPNSWICNSPISFKVTRDLVVSSASRPAFPGAASRPSVVYNRIVRGGRPDRSASSASPYVVWLLTWPVGTRHLHDGEINYIGVQTRLQQQ